MAEIRMYQARAKRMGFFFSVRLNATSDIDWQSVKYNGKSVFEIFTPSTGEKTSFTSLALSMRLFKKTNIDFMGKRYIWYSLSGLTLFVGLLAIIFKPVNYSIDFLGGTELVVRFQTAPPINEVRATMDKIGLAGSEIKTFGAPRDILLLTSEQGEGSKISDRIRAGLSAQFQDNKFEMLREERIGPKIGAVCE